MRVCVISLVACLAATGAGAVSYTITDLSALVPSDFLTPYSINERGQVTGWVYNDDAQLSRAFLWEKGDLTEIGLQSDGTSVFGKSSSVGYAINDAGQIAGTSARAGGAFI